MKVDGGCHCGAIRYEAEVDPAKVMICHCSDCQTLSGTAFRTVVPVPKDQFRLVSGKPKIYMKMAESGNRRQQAFCAECGTPIYSAAEKDTPAYSLRVGSLRQRAELEPKEQVWSFSARMVARLRWTEIRKVESMKTLLLALLLPFIAACATTSAPPPEAVKDLAPNGKLRAAINFGNIVLAQRGPANEPRGVSVDLAHELGRRLGVPVELVLFDGAGKVTDAIAADARAWDVAFLAIDPGRAKTIAYTAPYVLIEGTYMVKTDSPLRKQEDFDRPGIRIGVGAKSAYDLYLTRALKQAQLVRFPTGAQAIEEYAKGGSLDGVANVKQPLVLYAKNNPGMRVIEGRFMAIEQAMGTPQGRSGAGSRYLRQFVEEMKASGFVAAGLERSGQRDAMVAPSSP